VFDTENVPGSTLAQCEDFMNDTPENSDETEENPWLAPLTREVPPATVPPATVPPVTGSPETAPSAARPSWIPPLAPDPYLRPTAPTAPTPPVASVTTSNTGGPAPHASPERPPAPATSRLASSSMKSAIIGAVVGAVVAALVTAGTFVITDDDNADSGTTGSTAPLSTAAATVSKPASLADTDLRALLEKVRPAVVRIAVETDTERGEGTGFVVSSDGVIVTNSHVASDARNIEVTLADGDIEPAELLGADPNHDLAVIKIDRTDLATLQLGDSDPPVTQVGDDVIAVGNALGLEGQLSVTTGIVSALDRTLELGSTRLVSVIQTDAAINPGNSGGPLLNTRGEVIGINTAIARPEESNNVGFAISISSARSIIEALRAGKTPEIAFLGVDTKSVTPQVADEENLRSDNGALILEVVDGSPADDAGLQPNDVVISLDDEATDTREALLRLIRRHRVGDTITLKIERDGDVRTLTIQLGQLPADNA
jgi:S1-C subfamily serine protease